MYLPSWCSESFGVSNVRILSLCLGINLVGHIKTTLNWALLSRQINWGLLSRQINWGLLSRQLKRGPIIETV